MYNKKLLSKINLGKYSKSDPYKKDIIYDPMGQWKYPGQPTRIPSSNISMKGVNFPVLAVTDNGQKKMMQPGKEYNFPGANYVDEFPQAKKGGSLKSKKYTRSLDGIGSLFVESALFQKPKNNRKRIFHPKAKYYAEGGEPCLQGFQEDPVTGECIPIREKVEDIQEMPSPIVQKPPYYQESFVNPAAYVSGYRGGDPRMYKYGFLNSDQGNIIGGGGFGFPKPGVHLSASGVVPTSSNDRQYFKGAYEAGISKDFKNLNLGLGVNTAITGYPGENGFVRDPIKLQPKLNLRYNFKEGGASEQKIIFSPREGGCPEKQYWTGTECKIIPKNTKIVYSEEELAKSNISKKEQQKLYNQYISRVNNHNAYDAAVLKKYGKIGAKDKYYKTFESIPHHGWEPYMSYGSGKLMPPEDGIPYINEQMVPFKQWKKMMDKSSVKPIGFKGHPGGGHFYPIYEKPSNYLLGYNKEEEPVEEEFIPMPVKVPELINTTTGDIIGQSEQLLAPEYSPSYPKNRIGYDKYNWYTTKSGLPKRQKNTGGFYDKMSKKVKDLQNYMEGYDDEEGNHIPGEIEKAEQEGRQINFKGNVSKTDKEAQEAYTQEYDEYKNLKNYQNQIMNLMQYKLNKKQFGGLNKFVVGGMPDPGDVTCPEGYEINTITGRCVLIKGEPGFIKNELGEWVQDVAGKTVVEDANDERYKDYLIRKHLSDISKIPDFSRRAAVLHDFINSINNPNAPTDEWSNYYEKYYNPETGYDWTKGGTEDELEDETNKGNYGSRVQLFNNLTANQLNKTAAQKLLNDQGFPTQDYFSFGDYKDYVLANYVPDSYLGRASLSGLGSGYFSRELTYSDMKKPTQNSSRYISPSTSVVEDKINRDRLKEIYPDLTDKDINRSFQDQANNYISNDLKPETGHHIWDDLINYDKLREIKMSNQNDNVFRDYVNSTEKADDMFTRDNHVYYKPEDVRDYITSGLEVLPNYSEPVDKYIVRKTIDNADPSVELYTNPDAPEYSPTNTSVDRRTLDIKLPQHKIKRIFDRGIIDHKGHIKIGEREGTKFIPSLVQKFTGYDKDYMEGYIDDDGNYVPGEIENAQTEGRQINFKGRSSLNDKKAQETYNQNWTKYQTDKEAVKKQNIDLLEKYGLSTEEYLANTKKQGGSISKYNINTEHDLTDAEVARLKKLGYKLKKL